MMPDQTDSKKDVRAAKAALARWKAETSDGVHLEPNNNDHISAYILARQTSSRPRAADVLKIVANEKKALLKTPVETIIAKTNQHWKRT